MTTRKPTPADYNRWVDEALARRELADWQAKQPARTQLIVHRVALRTARTAPRSGGSRPKGSGGR